MKKILLFLAACIYTASASAQAPDFVWAKKFEPFLASIITADTAGNSYICGTYNATVTIGSTTLPYSGPGSNQFIAKIDPSGTALWAKPMTGIYTQGSETTPQKIIADNNGNIYLGSMCVKNSTTINGVPVAIPSSPGVGCYFLAKFDAMSGALQWIRTTGFSDTFSNNVPATVQFTKTGNICMMGLFCTSISFDSTHVLTNSGSTSSADGFAVTYDADGNVLKAIELGTRAAFGANNYEKFLLDKEDNIYRMVAINREIIKYDTLGNIVMTKQIVASGATYFTITSIAVDRNGNIFLGSWFGYGSLTVEGVLVPKYGPSTSTDALLIKLDPSGTLEWLKQFQAGPSDSYAQVYADDIGNVYAMGQHSDPSEVRTLLVKYSNAGTLLWQQLIIPGPGGPGAPSGFAEARALAPAKNGGNIYLAGSFKERIYFDAGTSYTTPVGAYKTFVARYGTCGTPAPTLTASSLSFCTGDSVLISASPSLSYLWSTNDTSNSIYVSATGDYSVIAEEDAECYAHSLPVHISSVAFPSTAVTQSGATLTAVESGAAYQWISCDDSTAIAGETNQTFTATANGNYALVISNSNGCTDTSACYPVVETGIAEASAAAISLYPNPVSDVLFINTSGKVKQVIIADLLGQQAMCASSRQLNVSLLAAGIYVVTVETEKGIFKQKFVKR